MPTTERLLADIKRISETWGLPGTLALAEEMAAYPRLPTFGVRFAREVLAGARPDLDFSAAPEYLIFGGKDETPLQSLEKLARTTPDMSEDCRKVLDYGFARIAQVINKARLTGIELPQLTVTRVGDAN